MSSNQAWVTLATNDGYCLGALVLAQSLKRVNTIYPIALLITPGVSQAMRELLSSVFDLVQEVNVLDSGDAANLALMARPELGVTFTKLHCWTLTQYSKCVFLDADTLVLRNCDELFERDELSAAPDVGWPDCFNSGVFVFVPSNDTYKALLEHAVAHGSFDGGDQGLLNQFFADWATKSIEKHLPFIYNMVSSAFYSYLPAFKQFGANVKIAHFIGGSKPWLNPLPSTSTLTGFLDIWWSIFRRDIADRLNTNMIINNRVFEAEPNATEVPFFSPNPSNPERHIFVDPWDEYEEVQVDSGAIQNGTASINNIPDTFNRPVVNESHLTNQERHRPSIPRAVNISWPQIRFPAVVHVQANHNLQTENETIAQKSEMPSNHSRLLQRHEPRTNMNKRDNAPRPQQPQVNIFAEPVRLLKKIGKPELVAEPQSGLAGALAAGERDEIETQWRKQSWEHGNIDYMGRDSFDNIWKKISETVGLGEAPPPKMPPAEATVKLSDILQATSAPSTESQITIKQESSIQSQAKASPPKEQSSFEDALKIVSAAPVAVAIPSQPPADTTSVPPIDVTLPTPPPSAQTTSPPPVPSAPISKPLLPPDDTPLPTPPPQQTTAVPPVAIAPPAAVAPPFVTPLPFISASTVAQVPAAPPTVPPPAATAAAPTSSPAVASTPAVVASPTPATVTSPAPAPVALPAPDPLACPVAPTQIKPDSPITPSEPIPPTQPVAPPPQSEAPVIPPTPPTELPKQEDKPSQKQPDQSKKQTQKSQKGGAKQSPPKTPPAESPAISSSPVAVPSPASPAAPESAKQPESPQSSSKPEQTPAPSPSQTGVQQQGEAAPVPPKRKGNQKSGKGKK